MPSATPGRGPLFSMIVCSNDPNKQRSICEEYARALHGEQYEFIPIESPKSLCEGYNRGIAKSRGDIIVLSHDDIDFRCDGLGNRIASALSNFDLVGVAGTSRLVTFSWYIDGSPHNHGRVIHTAVSPEIDNNYGPPP